MYSSNARATAHNYDVIVNGAGSEATVGFKSMADVRAKNKEIGHHFFDRDTMKYWGSKVESALYRGTFFITSEKGRLPTEPRKFTIRRVLPTGEIITEGTSRRFKTLDSAKDAVKGLIGN